MALLKGWSTHFFSAACLSLLASTTGVAQGTSELNGVVTDPAGIPVLSALVSVTGTSIVAATNERGEFQLRGLLAGPHEIRARRLGFAPSLRTVQVTASQNQNRIDFTLSPLPTNIRPVIVEATQVEYSGRLAGYYERLRRRSGGQFIDRLEIDKQESRTLSQLLSRMPGINSVTFRNGQGAVRMRGRNCRPLVWLDGVPMPAAEVDLNAFPISTLHGIELYLGSTTAPFDLQGMQNQAGCGTIALWSRGRDTEAPPPMVSRLLNLEEMAASQSVFTTDQVDTPARLVDPKILNVAYPASLFASGVAGAAVAEFVVGENGQIEGGTFSIVQTSHPLFAHAVSRALQGAKYEPARRKGTVVRQIIQQRFEFSPGGRAGKVSSLSGR